MFVDSVQERTRTRREPSLRRLVEVGLEMKVGDLVKIESQGWLDSPLLVIKKSWVKNEWIIWHPITGKLQWNEKRLKVVSETP